MRVLVTGANGFIAKNLIQHLSEDKSIEVVRLTRETVLSSIDLGGIDFIFHLAGVNRPQDVAEFHSGNTGLTQEFVEALSKLEKRVPVVFSSSTQAMLENDYGVSKKNAEDKLLELSRTKGNPVAIYRLPNVFGKWCRPNYNSVVATFCHNISHGLDISISDPAKLLKFVYVDTVIESFLRELKSLSLESGFREIEETYETSLGDLASKLKSFKDARNSLEVSSVGVGFERALYATYLSYQAEADFSYPLVAHTDPRGSFVEVLKTGASGQFSFFTAHPKVTRGGHYHHTKNEKFVVLKGTALFRFKSLLDGREHEITVSGESPCVVETIPGWTHDITNIGEDEMYVMLWANEVFDRSRPDTYARPLPKLEL